MSTTPGAPGAEARAPNPSDDAALAEAVLVLGYEIRARTQAAPFFGPRAPEALEAAIFAEIDALRRALEVNVHALAGPRPELFPMLKLEAEGCGETFFRGVSNLSSGGGASLEEDALSAVGVKPHALDRADPRVVALLAEERGVFLSRLAAVRGDRDPDHGVG